MPTVPREILKKIADEISTTDDQDNLQHADNPGYNDQAGSGFFPDFLPKTDSTSGVHGKDDA